MASAENNAANSADVVDVNKARSFVYSNGALWERALFGYLFDNRPVEEIHRALLAYKNPDGGFGHGLEPDLTCPDSNPLQLEFLLSLNRDTGLPVTDLLEGTVAWVEANRREDGSLKNPPTVHDYPLAPWWTETGGQRAPDAVTGNLTRLGVCSESLAASTRAWVLEHRGLEKIRENGWLFMAYHAFDYFMNVRDFPDLEAYREATVENIIALAEEAPERQVGELFRFAPTPESPLADRVPHLIERDLAHLEQTQKADGSWADEHGLPQWFPYTTIRTLLTLKRYGRAA